MQVNRRGFIRWSALAGGSLLATDVSGSYFVKKEKGAVTKAGETRIVRTGLKALSGERGKEVKKNDESYMDYILGTRDIVPWNPQ
jgi:hypothetical protein